MDEIMRLDPVIVQEVYLTETDTESERRQVRIASPKQQFVANWRRLGDFDEWRIELMWQGFQAAIEKDKAARQGKKEEAKRGRTKTVSNRRSRRKK